MPVSKEANIMRWDDLPSSNIAKAAYYEGDLYIQFINGRKYRYFEVPQRVVSELLVAESVGKYFNDEIRDEYITEPFMYEEKQKT